MTGSYRDPVPTMLATSLAAIIGHREITAVLVTSAAFLISVIAMGWLVV